jgi:hypothetical protein
VAERPNASALKAEDGRPSGGSNPSASAALTCTNADSLATGRAVRSVMGLNSGIRNQVRTDGCRSSAMPARPGLAGLVCRPGTPAGHR